jgi:adenylate cyclase
MAQQVLSVSEEARARVRRRLAAVLVAGYSPLFPGDEADGLAGLRALVTDVIEPRIAEFGGQMINWTGERALVEFDSVVEATRYAALLRDCAAQKNEMLRPEQRIALRIGINLGDIVVESGDIFGDGVNIAARIESVAAPGGISLSEDAWRQVQGKVAANFVDSGEQSLKNIARTNPRSRCCRLRT